MKQQVISILAASVVGLMVANLQAAPMLDTGKITPKPVLNGQTMKQKKLLSCPDLSAKLSVQNIRKNADGSYDFNLWAAVANSSPTAYKSKPGQQFAMLSENRPGAGSRQLRQINFVNLTPGQQAREFYQVRNVRLSTEFLPGYSVKILYGPDIHADGNVHNDDCHSGNNTASLSGEQIRRLLGLHDAAARRVPSPSIAVKKKPVSRF